MGGHVSPLVSKLPATNSSAGQRSLFCFQQSISRLVLPSNHALTGRKRICLSVHIAVLPVTLERSTLPARARHGILPPPPGEPLLIPPSSPRSQSESCGKQSRPARLHGRSTRRPCAVVCGCLGRKPR